MPCNAKKDLSNCLARAKVRILGGKHFFSIYLWDTKEDLNLQAQIEGGDAEAACCHMPESAILPARTFWRWLVLKFTPQFIQRRFIKFEWRTPPKAGEIHFYRNAWTMENVAHECAHATLGAARAYGLTPGYLMDGSGELSSHLMRGDFPEGAISDEELFCYIQGELFDAVFRWLWGVNPYGKHAK